MGVGGLAAPRSHALPGRCRRAPARSSTSLLRLLRRAAGCAPASCTEALARQRRRLLRQRESGAVLSVEILNEACYVRLCFFFDIANLWMLLEMLMLLLL